MQCGLLSYIPTLLPSSIKSVACNKLKCSGPGGCNRHFIWIYTRCIPGSFICAQPSRQVSCQRPLFLWCYRKANEQTKLDTRQRHKSSHVTAIHCKCVCLSILTVVASLLILGLSGATRKDTAGNRHHPSPLNILYFGASISPCSFFASEKQFWSEACRSMWNVGKGTRRRPLHFSQLPKQISPKHRVCLHPWR